MKQNKRYGSALSSSVASAVRLGRVLGAYLGKRKATSVGQRANKRYKCYVKRRKIGGGNSTGFEYKKTTRFGRKGKRFTKNFYKEVASNYYISTAAASYTCPVGQQSHNILQPVLDDARLTNFVSVSATTNKRTWIEWAKQWCVFTNVCNANVVLHIYDMVCKRNTDKSPSTCVIDGLKELTGGTTFETCVGTNSLMSPALKTYWKLKAHKRVMLKPGEVFNYTSFRRIYKHLPCTVYQDNTDTYVSGYTGLIMIRLHGMPDNDSLGTVSFGSGKVDCVYRQDVKFKYVNSQASTSLVGTATFNTYGGTEKVMPDYLETSTTYATT